MKKILLMLAKDNFKQMKTNKFVSFLMMLMFVLGTTVALTSCGDEDDPKMDEGDNTEVPDKDKESDKSEIHNGHEAIDLGLSVKWATMNIGATTPEGYGDYFAWGETRAKTTYNWETYRWCNGSDKTLTKYCTSSTNGTVDNKSTLDPEDDAAHVNWGGSWRIPTYEELRELRNNCTWTWTTQNGVNGYEVTSKTNGNSIFLPAAGYIGNSGLSNAGSLGEYWSSLVNKGFLSFAEYLQYNSKSVDMDFYGRRFYGMSVRAVCP